VRITGIAFRRIGAMPHCNAGSLPLFAFAGLWTRWRGVRGPKSAPFAGDHELFGFLTTNAHLSRSSRSGDGGPVRTRLKRAPHHRVLDALRAAGAAESSRLW
jgi:hypothetical protein